MSRIVSILLLLAGAALAAAGGAWAGPRDEDLFIRPIDQHWVLFASADAGSSVFLSGGSKQSLVGPLDRPGFLSLETSGFGYTRETMRLGSLRIPVDRYTYQSSVLGGYQFMSGPLYVAAYVGPELQTQQVAYSGTFARFSQPRLGVRGQVEIWYNPTPDTLLTTTVVASSASASLWARGAAGIRLWGKAFIGPEATVYTTPTYRETRWGMHLTGPAIGIVNLRVSAGVMTDDGRRSVSPYFGLSAWMRL